jgi:hypothetical protein
MTWNGAHDRIRTDDLLLTMEMLYRLSYVGFGRPGTLLRRGGSSTNVCRETHAADEVIESRRGAERRTSPTRLSVIQKPSGFHASRAR